MRQELMVKLEKSKIHFKHKSLCLAKLERKGKREIFVPFYMELNFIFSLHVNMT